MSRSSRALRRALFACAAGALPDLAQAEDASSVRPLLVEGHAPVADAPLTTRTIGAETIARAVNALTAEDVLKHQPAIFARRRHIGDTQAPITTRTSGVGASARSLIYVDGVPISALIGNNNSSASPRWGMVTPAEIDHVEVRYGPFSAAYPGNSMGAVVEITTRDPKGPEANAASAVEVQSYRQYGTQGTYPAYLGQVSAGDRRDDFAWRLSLERLNSRGQPLAFVTALRRSSPSTAGAPLTGAFADVNRAGQPIAVLGAGGLEHQLVDNAKLKLAWSPSPAFQAGYFLGFFGNRDRAEVQSYLKDSAGQAVYAGTLNIGGYAYSIPASAFSNNTYRLEEQHWMQALSLKGRATADLSWQAIASLYDYGRDTQRTPAGALPGAFTGGPGTILDLGGTGWETFDARLTWKALTGGVHYDQYRLGSDRYATSDWLSGAKGALTAAARGRTDTRAVFLEQTMPLTPDLRLTLGAREEAWRASDGFNFQAAPALAVRQPSRSETRTSPKAVLAWTPDEAWALTASAGVAWRFPTVSELYQAVSLGSQVYVPNPDLAPERAVSTEFSARRRFGWGEARASLFTEDVSDALISQAALTPFGSTSFVQNIDKVRSRGAEAEVEVRDVLPDVDLSGSVTWVDSRIVRDRAFPTAEGKRTPQIPRLRWTAVATWRATERLTLTGAARYSDRVFGTIDNSDRIAHTWQGFEGYLVLDARAVLKVDPHWQAAVGLENLGNRSYYLFHPFPQRAVLAELRYAY